MRLVFIAFFFVSVLFSCRDSATAQTSETVVGTVDYGAKLREDPKDEADSDKPLVLRFASAEAAEGQRVCLPVSVESFDGLIGYQFAIKFDSASLRFETFRNYGLPGMGAGNFGSRVADRGVLSTLWTDGALKGVTLPEKKTLFEACFTNLMEEGRETEVRFLNELTPFEVIQADMKQRKIRYANGVVRSR